MKRFEISGALQQQHHFDASESTEHKNFTVGEVDKLQDAIDHGITQGDQRVHEAQDNAIQKNLRQDFQCEFQAGADPSEAAMLTNSWSPR